MSGELEYFFDFMSPFAYLAHDSVCQLAKRYDRDLIYKPINLPEAKIAAGNTGPSNREIPVKLRYLLIDINRWAEKRDLPEAFPASLDPHKMNAGTFYALERGVAEKYVREAFALGWGQGGDMSAERTLSDLAETMGWSVAEFVAYASMAKELPEYIASNTEAVEKGVFGVPTIIIDDQMWWGNDRLSFVEEFLAQE